MANLYLRCGSGVSSFVIHSNSSNLYPQTVTGSSWGLYSGFGTSSSDAWVSDVKGSNGGSVSFRLRCYDSRTSSNYYDFAEGDNYITPYSSSVRCIEVYATSAPTPTSYDYYYQIKYLNSNGTQIGASDVQHVTSTSRTGYNVSAANISAPSGWTKSGTYSAGQYCTYANGYFTINSISTHQTTASSYAVFNVYVTQITYKLTMKLYTENGSEIGTATREGIAAGTTINPISAYGDTYNPNANTYKYSYATNASGTVITQLTVSSNVTVNFYYAYNLYYGQLSFSVNGGTWSDGTTAAKTQNAQSQSSTISAVIPTSASYVPKRSKYTFAGWKKSGGVEETVYKAGDTVKFTSTSHDPNNRTVQTMSAYWIDATVKPFWWDGGTGSMDNALIFTGNNVSNITAARWNALLTKIKELAQKLNVSFSYATVASGDTFTAVTFNTARNGINAIKTALSASTPLCGTVTANVTEIKAAYFVGSGSLRDCLNALITIYNDSIQ